MFKKLVSIYFNSINDRKFLYNKFFNNVNLEQELLQYLMDEGLESGLIGKA